MDQRKNIIPILVLLWILGTAVRFLFFHEINEALWILSSLIGGGLILAGVVLMVILLLRKDRAGVVAAFAIGGILGISWFTSLGWLSGTYFRMWRMESAYQDEVDRIMNLDEAALETLKSSADVDEGPPRRIVFSWGGILDNWTGIVYDPSGEVILARRGSGGGEPAPDRIRFLFGGDLYDTLHLWGHWDYCRFT